MNEENQIKEEIKEKYKETYHNVMYNLIIRIKELEDENEKLKKLLEE